MYDRSSVFPKDLMIAVMLSYTREGSQFASYVPSQRSGLHDCQSGHYNGVGAKDLP
jgi:hypothetical protein